ncbi:MAG: hypothetical protein WC683_02330 [bacterium]
MGNGIYSPRYFALPDIIGLATHLEDDPAVSGDRGVFALAVRNDLAATILTSANGDYSGIAVDDRGRLFTLSGPSPAGTWQTLRVFAATIADVATPAVIQVLGPGAVNLAGLVYPVNALIGLTVTINGQTCTFIAADVVSQAAILNALNVGMPDITWTDPGNFLLATKDTPGNIVLSGTALVILGLNLLPATTGPWVAFPVSSPMIEIGYPPGFSVANAPQEVILRVWRLSGATGGVADICGEMRMNATDINSQESRRFSFDGTHAYATVEFVGGTAPTITGTLDIRPVFDGDQAIEAPTFHAVGPSILAHDFWDNAPTQAVYNYSTLKGDGTAVRLANTTITFTITPGLTAPISSQLCRVRVFIDATTKPLVWEQGRNAILSIAAGVITVNALDGTVITVPVAATLVEVMWSGPEKGVALEDSAHVSGEYITKGGRVRRDVPVNSAGSDGEWCAPGTDADGYDYTRDKAYDAAGNDNRVAEIAPLWSKNVLTPINVIAAAQNIAVAWADLGPEIGCQGYKTFCLQVDVDINTCVNVRFRALALTSAGGAKEFALPCKVVDSTAAAWLVKVQPHVYELDLDVDQKQLLDWVTDNAISTIQFQVSCESMPGAAGQVLTAELTYGY